jgi:hypothetical protein
MSLGRTSTASGQGALPLVGAGDNQDREDVDRRHERRCHEREIRPGHVRDGNTSAGRNLAPHAAVAQVSVPPRIYLDRGKRGRQATLHGRCDCRPCASLTAVATSKTWMSCLRLEYEVDPLIAYRVAGCVGRRTHRRSATRCDGRADAGLITSA